MSCKLIEIMSKSVSPVFLILRCSSTEASGITYTSPFSILTFLDLFSFVKEKVYWVIGDY